MPLDIPLQLAPVFLPKIWGRRDLAPLFARPPDTRGQGAPQPGRAVSPPASEDRIGEVWLTGEEARFLNGPLCGLPLEEASRTYGPELHGKGWKGDLFPVLAKYIYTRDWLSIQVHPDDDYARAHDPGNLGKCEMWYIVQADRGAEFLLGLKPGLEKESLSEQLTKGDSRHLLHCFRPGAGEAIFVPPGTVHALGPGLVLFEAEENSDLTYRLDDFGRVGLDGKPRPLHWEKGLEVIQTERPPLRNLPHVKLREPFGWRRFVLASRFFAVEELTLRKAGSFKGSPERVEVLSLLEGEGRVETAAGGLTYRTGDTWLIPPATQRYRLAPRRETRLLKFYVPDLDKDFRSPLAARGVAASKIKKIVFD